MPLDWTTVSEWVGRVEPLLRFVHGLSFFVLGVVLLLLVPRASRMEIGRRLPLLAVFGFCEALVAWDDVLSPALEVAWLIPPLGRTFLLGAGYLFLLAFGLLALVPPGPRVQARVGGAVLVGSGWLLGLVALLLLGLSAAQVSAWGDVLARYGFALPGGMLSALGLRQQARRTMHSAMLQRAKGPLRAAGVTLGVFGALAGLQALAEAILFPISILYAACGLSLTVTIVWALSVVQREIERWVEDVEKSQALSTDRERISRELHDGTIQAIYAAGLMLEGVMQAIQEDPKGAQEQLSRTMASLNQAIQDIRRYIFNLRGDLPSADLESGLEQLLEDFRINTLIEATLTIDGEKPRPMRVEQRNHIFQVVREALSNTARHARARKVAVALVFGANRLHLHIADDGVGFGHEPICEGQGLRNIQERTRLLDGVLDIDGDSGHGVEITLVVPY